MEHEKSPENFHAKIRELLWPPIFPKWPEPSIAPKDIEIIKEYVCLTKNSIVTAEGNSEFMDAVKYLRLWVQFHCICFEDYDYFEDQLIYIPRSFETKDSLRIYSSIGVKVIAVPKKKEKKDVD